MIPANIFPSSSLNASQSQNEIPQTSNPKLIPITSNPIKNATNSMI